jgi:two-component system, NtrC family, nitrogen regulation sensor histidine kinase NtrY
MSRSLTRPIRELVEWSGKLAREEPLPDPTRRETGEVKELQALRGALRNASAEMRSARARALETERTRSWGEMARRVAHEMKNPLTPLRLASHRLAAVAVERPELAEPIAVIAEETRRLEELASRFALLGRPAEGPRAQIDLADLLQRLLSSDVPDDADVRLDVDSTYPYTLADYNALMQVFRNLVRNSLEATPPGERPVLRLRIADEASWLKVTLADQGRGFGDYAPDEVFEPDFTSKAHGTGLGLAIARQIIRAHGGDISAQPGEKGGAQFIVKLQRSIEEDGVT